MEQVSEVQTPVVAQPFEEKRRFHRRRVLKGGTMLFNRGFNSYGCRIRNLTDQGAMVEMGETTGVPHNFDFQFDDNSPVSAEIIWRTHDRMGIQFVQ